MCSFFIATDLLLFLFLIFNTLCHELGQPHSEKCLTIRLQLRQGFLLLVHL